MRSTLFPTKVTDKRHALNVLRRIVKKVDAGWDVGNIDFVINREGIATSDGLREPYEFISLLKDGSFEDGMFSSEHARLQMYAPTGIMKIPPALRRSQHELVDYMYHIEDEETYAMLPRHPPPPGLWSDAIS